MKSNIKQKASSVDCFSYEWKQYTGTAEDEDLLYKTKTTPEFFKDKIILDAGCGNGRLTRLSAEYGAKHVIGVDLSESVLTARENTRHLQNVSIIRASIYDLPFKENIFDFIFSIGVLHHTPNPKQAFFSLLHVVKQGGTVAVWVYGPYHSIHRFVINTLRKITTRIPYELLYKLCWLQKPLGGVCKYA